QEYYFGNNNYIAKELNPQQISINYNKIYLKTGKLNATSKQQLADDLETNNKVVKILFAEDLKYTFNNTSKSISSIILLIIAFSIALGIMINYNLLLINIHTRKREIATLKVLGYQEKEVSGYVFRETLIISIFAILIGLLLGKILHYFIISQIVIDGVLLYNSIGWQSYIYTILMSMVFLVFVYLMSIPHTKKINMIEALKSYE
ncbi:MAG: ABC transporter permease, partial [Erysipelotrichia bacterium]|nr:ABC transporter permease [Erysipelotrichia bacterium]